MEKYNPTDHLSDLTLAQLTKVIDSGCYEVSRVTQAKINKFLAFHPNSISLNELRRKKLSNSRPNLIYKPEFIKATLDAYEFHGIKKKPTSHTRVQHSKEIRKLQRPKQNFRRSCELLPTKSLYQLGLIAGKGFNFDKLISLQEKLDKVHIPPLLLNRDQNERPLTVRSVAMTCMSLTSPSHFNIPKLLPSNWDDLFPPCTPVPMNTPRNLKKETELFEIQQYEQPHNFSETSAYMSESKKNSTAHKPGDISDNKTNSETSKEANNSDLHSLFLLPNDNGSGSSSLQKEDEIKSERNDNTVDPVKSVDSMTILVRSSLLDEHNLHPNQGQDIPQVRNAKAITSSNLTSSVVSSRDSLKVMAGSSTSPDVSIAGSDEIPMPQPSTERALPPNERAPTTPIPRNQSQWEEDSGTLLRSRTVSALRTKTSPSKRYGKSKGSLPIMPQKPKKS